MGITPKITVNFTRDPHGRRGATLSRRTVCGGPKLTRGLYKTSARRPRRWRGQHSTQRLYESARDGMCGSCNVGRNAGNEKRERERERKKRGPAGQKKHEAKKRHNVDQKTPRKTARKTSKNVKKNGTNVAYVHQDEHSPTTNNSHHKQ